MWLEPVRQALDRTDAAVSVFFRDDDAGWDDAGLLAMLDVFGERNVPVDLAVIPAAIGATLAFEIDARRRAQPGLIGIHQHGNRHLNHECEGRKCEFGPARPYLDQLHDIRAGWQQLTASMDAVDPIFTPPWNRCTPTTFEVLEHLGYAAVSRDSTAGPIESAEIAQIPVAVDWCRLSQGHDAARWNALGLRIADVLAESDLPVGIMLHHAEMGAEDRERLDGLLRLLARHPRVVVLRMAECIPRRLDRPAHRAD